MKKIGLMGLLGCHKGCKGHEDVIRVLLGLFRYTDHRADRRQRSVDDSVAMAGAALGWSLIVLEPAFHGCRIAIVCHEGCTRRVKDALVAARLEASFNAVGKLMKRHVGVGFA